MSQGPIELAGSWYRRADRAVKGWPESALTLLLVGIGAFCFVVAFSDNRVLKAGLAAWMILP